MFLQETKVNVLVYKIRDLIPLGFIDSDFQSNRDSQKFSSRFGFTLFGGSISWKSVMLVCITCSTMEAEN